MRFCIYFLFTLLFFSCKKTDQPDISVKGRILHANDSTAYANTSFLVYQYYVPGYNQKGQEVTTPFVTDNDGNFYVTFKKNSGVASICYTFDVSSDKQHAIATENIESNLVDKVFDFGTLYAKR